MNNTFDEAYARYLNFLARLDGTNDISEKSVLFRQITEQLSELEHRLNNPVMTEREEPARGQLVKDEPAGTEHALTYSI